MIEKNAFDLIQQYINGWKQNNLPMITSSLDENCLIIESHGPTYHGIPDIEHWFKFWLEAQSQVKKWDITSFSFWEKESTAFVEWDFSCLSDEIEYSFSGISIIKFNGEKISFIHEYRMTRPAYQWEGNKLKSE